jgi:hypothetical protein
MLTELLTNASLGMDWTQDHVFTLKTGEDTPSLLNTVWRYHLEDATWDIRGHRNLGTDPTTYILKCPMCSGKLWLWLWRYPQIIPEITVLNFQQDVQK